MRTALAILLLSILACLALAARADGIYKWVDEDGVVHFGAQPPQKEEVEVVRKPKSERMKQWQAQQAALKAAEEPTSEEKAVSAKPEPREQEQPQQDEALTKAQQAVRAQRCRMARSNLQELTTHSRVRELGPDGKMRVLPEEERQQRIAREQQTVQDNC